MRRIVLLVFAAAAICGCSTMDAPAPCAAASATSCAAPLKVGVYADRGPGGIGAVEWFRLVDESPEMSLTLLDSADVRAGRLEGLDVLVMPGGSSKTEYDSLGVEGVAKMKEFMRSGGGYIGTCAGCCLLMDGPKQRARVVPWNTCGSEGDLFFPQFKLTPAGQKALGLGAGPHVIRYHGGPFLWPTTNRIAEANVEVWGTFNAEATFKGRLNKDKKMFGAAAILGGTYGKGRLFATSAHPEYFECTLPFVKAAFRYVTGRDVTFPARTRRPRALSVGFLAKGISGKDAAETALALSKVKDFDLVLIDKDGIFMRRMDNIDVLVVPSAVFKKDKGIAAAISALESRGGKVLYCCSGADKAPAGAAVSTTGDAVVDDVRRLFPQPTAH
ncbi:MAG: hypothetical protein IKO72_14650 [Kiritimatiellae bacterium]|nr:hypothetical protein [Kiritimatiellia bacterium]